jgi:glycosyltransferase involved in cell wall biosynthesis
MKVAIIHYWLVGMRGGEKVIEQLCQMYPGADIYTHVVNREKISDTILKHRIETTFISKLPLGTRHYQKYLPLMPLALEQIDLRGYDLIISSESGPAKGIVPMADAVHVCYCHSPMRYIWNMYNEYSGGLGRIAKPVFSLTAHYLRMWDSVGANRVDRFVANSANVARRIDRYYARRADVVFPPVDVSRFRPSTQDDGFYLVAGQLAGYKRVDLAVEAFNRMGKRLVVAGGGEQYDALRKIAGPTISMLGHVSDTALDDLFARCRALLFPGEEDFGIVPVEAMASGKPVIAYGRGGALETVVGDATGIFFRQQSVDDLIDAVERFEADGVMMAPHEIAAHTRRFDVPVFRRRMSEAIELAMAEDKAGYPGLPAPEPAHAADEATILTPAVVNTGRFR